MHKFVQSHLDRSICHCHSRGRGRAVNKHIFNSTPLLWGSLASFSFAWRFISLHRWCQMLWPDFRFVRPTLVFLILGDLYGLWCGNSRHFSCSLCPLIPDVCMFTEPTPSCHWQRYILTLKFSNRESHQCNVVVERRLHRNLFANTPDPPGCPPQRVYTTLAPWKSCFWASSLLGSNLYSKMISPTLSTKVHVSITQTSWWKMMHHL